MVFLKSHYYLQEIVNDLWIIQYLNENMHEFCAFVNENYFENVSENNEFEFECSLNDNQANFYINVKLCKKN